MSDNIFGFDDPDDLWCSVHTYHISHSTLSVRVGSFNGTTPVYWLGFAGVAYFSGMMSWKGANFRISTQNELISLLRELGYDELQIRKTMLPMEHKLYIADAIRPQAEKRTRFQVLIYAYSYSIKQEESKT